MPAVCDSRHELEQRTTARYTFLAFVALAVTASALASSAGATPRPETPSITGPAATVAGSHTYVFSSLETGVATSRLHYRCSLDSPHLRSCRSEVTFRLTAGHHVLRAEAVDPAGRRSGVAELRIAVAATTPQLTPRKVWQESLATNATDDIFGVAIGPDGDLYVSNAAADDVVVLDTAGKELRSFGGPGAGPGEFQFENNPDPADAGIPFSAIAVDHDTGAVFVSEPQRVEKFDAQGDYELQWGSAGTGPGQFSRIVDLGIDGAGTVYALEDRPDGLGRVQEFDANGTFRTTFGRGKIVDSGGLTVAPTGDVLVADDKADLIRVFGSDGTQRRTFGRPGDQPGQLDFPTELAVAGDTLYVADTDHGRIVRFDLESGAPTGYWPVEGGPDTLAVDSTASNLYVINGAGLLTRYQLAG